MPLALARFCCRRLAANGFDGPPRLADIGAVTAVASASRSQRVMIIAPDNEERGSTCVRRERPFVPQETPVRLLMPHHERQPDAAQVN